MKKKAIEKIPYLGLKQVSSGQDVKYIGVTALKIVGHEKHLLLEVYRNEKESMNIPVVRIAVTKKDFGTYRTDQDIWTREKIAELREKILKAGNMNQSELNSQIRKSKSRKKQ